jgi:hypothetical protein
MDCHVKIPDLIDVKPPGPRQQHGESEDDPENRGKTWFHVYRRLGRWAGGVDKAYLQLSLREIFYSAESRKSRNSCS